MNVCVVVVPFVVVPAKLPTASRLYVCVRDGLEIAGKKGDVALLAFLRRSPPRP